MSTIVHTYPVTITDASIPVTPRDELMTGAANAGLRFLFDLANGYSYTAGTPTGGKAVRDIAEVSAAGSIANADAAMVAGGNGLDFTAIAATDHGVKVPASVLADLFADQEYLVCSYGKMPAAADWPAVTTGLGGTWVTATVGTDTYQTAPELALIACALNTTGRITYRRQTALNAQTELVANGCTIHGGLLTQVAFWRSATNCGLRLKSAAGTSISSLGAAGSKNTLDFSGKTLNFGPFGGYGYAASVVNWRKGQRLYRGFVENLHRSGRDPIVVLDADYPRVVSRGVYT